MGSIIIVTGLPGVGKTTVLDKAIEKLKRDGVNIGLVNYGTVMLNIARDIGLVKHRDEMRKLNIAQQLEIQKEAAKKLNELAKLYDMLIIDTHLFINTPRGRWPGISLNNLSVLNISQIIIVEASPEEIIRRREKDEDRVRDKANIEIINDDLKYNRIMAAALSIYTSCPVSIIKNHDGWLEKASNEIYNILSLLLKDRD